jgi:hypothetical protein
MHRGPLTKTNLLTTLYAGAPLEVVETYSLLKTKERYESMEEIWPDYPTDEDYLWNEDEY